MTIVIFIAIIIRVRLCLIRLLMIIMFIMVLGLPMFLDLHVLCLVRSLGAFSGAVDFFVEGPISFVGALEDTCPVFPQRLHVYSGSWEMRMYSRPILICLTNFGGGASKRTADSPLQ